MPAQDEGERRTGLNQAVGGQEQRNATSPGELEDPFAALVLFLI